MSYPPTKHHQYAHRSTLAHLHSHICTSHIHICAYIDKLMNIVTHIYAYMCLHRYTCIILKHTNTYACTCTHSCLYAHAYINSHIQTQMLMYVHIHTSLISSPLFISYSSHMYTPSCIHAQVCIVYTSYINICVCIMCISCIHI